MSTLLLWATVSIFFSFLCSILEAVLLSVTPTFISVKKQEKKDYAFKLEALKADVDQPLIAILTLNTIAHTLGAMMVGIEAEKLPYKLELFGINTVGIVSAIMTLLILIVSEIIPKTIGASYWKSLVGFTATSLNILIFPLKYTGILWLLRLTTKLIGGKGHGSVLSREDFHAMTDIAEEEGVFHESESKVIKNMLTFKEVLAKDVMTPRTVMTIEDEDQTIQAFFKNNANIKFSRIPVFTNNPDNITGLVLKDEVFKEMAFGNGSKLLSDIKRNIIIVNRSMPIPRLFEQLIESKNHMALVVDEYGSVSGLVTMEDVIETLLGLEIMDESDDVPDLQQLARRSWEARAQRLGLIDDINPDE
ncbi:CNNM domain-containing protein [Xanthomarina sp. F2636L]|uniref:CNNM domain-containing protein n=1 Tax=Xanthomarina sp. F2636L TaxID=2996018 RepID=UPI00225DD5DE|nr:hemolysin family protein [Xanthomarina sp. F2636L]MCX7551405.1 hemolysin family protein [Xanthomarina sp. F2636L]